MSQSRVSVTHKQDDKAMPCELQSRTCSHVIRRLKYRFAPEAQADVAEDPTCYDWVAAGEHCLHLFGCAVGEQSCTELCALHCKAPDLCTLVNHQCPVTTCHVLWGFCTWQYLPLPPQVPYWGLFCMHAKDNFMVTKHSKPSVL